MNKIYFAHAKSDYGTPRERIVLGLIERRFPGWKIVDPNYYQEAFSMWMDRLAVHREHPMQFWTDLVGACDALVFLFASEGNGDFYMTAGVAQEVLHAHVKDIACFQAKIVEHQFGGTYAELNHSLVYQDVMTIEETRAYIEAEHTASVRDLDEVFNKAAAEW